MATGKTRDPHSNITYLTLPSGIPLVHVHCPGTPVDYCGLTVRAGSRDDAPGHFGLAHFVEHTIFKGTRRRSSWHIINRMESVGGELNAYTTKEETVVYTCAPRGNLARSVELLADLVANSRFPATELAKESEVVADEIDSYLDSPSEAVFDEFEDLLFAGTPLGHNILGTKDSLKTFDSQLCRAYLDTYYVPGNMVAFYCGAMAPSRVHAVMQRHYSIFTGPTPTRPAIAADHRDTFCVERSVGSHQAHTVMGSATGSMFSPERYAVALLTNIIGGPGMNSLLNIELREHRGLVYTADANASLLSDTGMLSIYFGCDPSDTDRCVRLVGQCIDSLAQTAMPVRRLDRAKKQYLGQLAVAGDNRENTTLACSRATLYHGRATTPAQIADHILALTPDDIRSAAATLLPLNRLTLK